MVNVHLEEPVAVAPHAAALALFERQWQIYQTCVDHDYFSSAGATAVLHDELVRSFPQPFRFVDLACGDAGGTCRALQGTAVAHYHGVDLATPALDRAALNLRTLSCEVTLEQKDFVEAMVERPAPANAVWIGLSLHHLQQDGKRRLMCAIREMLTPGGMLLVYEPTCREGEDGPAFLDRYEAIARDQFTALDGGQLDTLMAHVRSADYPETMASWQALGRAAGFADARHLFTGRCDMMRVLRFAKG